MSELPVNHRKIINDPVYGFISLPYELAYEIIEHPWFQRMRRIKQLGLTNFVYPGANHTRFQHALGAAYLMSSAIQIIRSKGHEITDEESEAVIAAILLHDTGHGPFSHALEKSLIRDISHEEISLHYMIHLNEIFKGRLDLAIDIFRNKYHKKFLHQLVDSQLDMDRLDYLKRDSFFTGVTEGVIGSDRIIKMLNVKNDQLVIDHKGIYSIEKFLVARRLMYWQVYFHKTVIAAENLLVMILQRAKELTMKGHSLFGTPALLYFLEEDIERNQFAQEQEDILHYFSLLDDNDIMSAAKVWSNSTDIVLSTLCRNLMDRILFKTEILLEPVSRKRKEMLQNIIVDKYLIEPSETIYFLVEGEISNFAYNSLDDRIKILLKNNEILDIATASDMLNVAVLSKNIKKYFLCYPKNIRDRF